jgi:hypothetical protein
MRPRASERRRDGSARFGGGNESAGKDAGEVKLVIDSTEFISKSGDISTAPKQRPLHGASLAIASMILSRSSSAGCVHRTLNKSVSTFAPSLVRV